MNTTTPDLFNYSLIPLFKNNLVQSRLQNNEWINPSNISENLFTYLRDENAYYLSLTKSSLTSSIDTFAVSTNGSDNTLISNSGNTFILKYIRIRLNSNLYNYFVLTYISVLTDANVYKKFIVEALPNDKNFYIVFLDNKIKIKSNTPLLNLIKFTIEPMKYDQNTGFHQNFIYEDVKNLELITVELGGKIIDPNDPENIPGNGCNTSKFANKNILNDLANYRINILEYQKKITIFACTKNKQISIFNIKCVNYSYVTMNCNDVSVPAKVRTYKLGKGVLYNVNLVATNNDKPIFFPEIKVDGGEFTSYKKKNEKEIIQIFYVDVIKDFVFGLPNRKCKRIFIVSGVDEQENIFLQDLVFMDSNPIEF